MSWLVSSSWACRPVRSSSLCACAGPSSSHKQAKTLRILSLLMSQLAPHSPGCRGDSWVTSSYFDFCDAKGSELWPGLLCFSSLCACAGPSSSHNPGGKSGSEAGASLVAVIGFLKVAQPTLKPARNPPKYSAFCTSCIAVRRALTHLPGHLLTLHDLLALSRPIKSNSNTCTPSMQCTCHSMHLHGQQLALRGFLAAAHAVQGRSGIQQGSFQGSFSLSYVRGCCCGRFCLHTSP